MSFGPLQKTDESFGLCIQKEKKMHINNFAWNFKGFPNPRLRTPDLRLYVRLDSEALDFLQCYSIHYVGNEEPAKGFSIKVPK